MIEKISLIGNGWGYKISIYIYSLNLFLNLQEQIWLEKEHLSPG